MRTRFKLFVLFVALWIPPSCESPKCSAAPPEPFVRMSSPSGCSGTVVHASREYGVFIVTCGHCVNRPGSARFYFFKDGVTSPSISGRCLRSHSAYGGGGRNDVSLCWVSADNFRELPNFVPIATSKVGLYKGQVVLAVGSFAGGTKHPAMRKCSVISTSSNARAFTLNDSAWGGHSGGGVIDIQTMTYLGPLWGASRGRSHVTGPTSVHELIWGQTQTTGQAMMSVKDDVTEVALPMVSVDYRDHSSAISMQAEIVRYGLHRVVRFQFRQSGTAALPTATWRSGGKLWYTSFRGAASFAGYLQRTGISVVGCYGDNCPPGGGYSPFNPGGGGSSPWTFPKPGTNPIPSVPIPKPEPEVDLKTRILDALKQIEDDKQRKLDDADKERDRITTIISEQLQGFLDKINDGVQGERGLTGQQGPQGLPGINGTVGPIGPTGPARSITVIFEDSTGKQLAKSVVIPPGKSTVRVPINRIVVGANK